MTYISNCNIKRHPSNHVQTLLYHIWLLKENWEFKTAKLKLITNSRLKVKQINFKFERRVCNDYLPSLQINSQSRYHYHKFHFSRGYPQERFLFRQNCVHATLRCHAKDQLAASQSQKLRKLNEVTGRRRQPGSDFFSLEEALPRWFDSRAIYRPRILFDELRKTR